MRILGVDYSGAITDRHTWLADGLLHEDELVLRGCRPVTRAELTETLADQTEPTVAALDFPFSVPRPFAHYWQPDASTMPQLWAAAAAMDLPEFMALRDRFVAGWGELKRWADTFYPECYSCLHKANPNLVPMTFRGTQMLDRLWGAGCSVPPLAAPAPARSHERTVLLEAMPGAALKALRLPYKGYKKGVRRQQLRQQILEGLPQRLPIQVRNLGELQDRCLQSHDCLDAVVAAVTAALWAKDPSTFRCPPTESSEDFDPVVLLEGWLYAPVYLPSGTKADKD